MEPSALDRNVLCANKQQGSVCSDFAERHGECAPAAALFCVRTMEE
jgi:hypothetical protein